LGIDLIAARVFKCSYTITLNASL